VGLIDIPPYVLAREPPPNASGEEPSFHLRSYLMPAPIDFPRDLFVEALADHARLVESHGTEILGAPLRETDGDGKNVDLFLSVDDIDAACTLLVSDGVAHEIHKWRAQQLSYVVQRCRGIVLKLMESAPAEHTYVVVVARGVASLQLVRGHEPRRVGGVARLEVVERDIVVEPWEQWHRRDGEWLVTWWTTPAGELAASRVRLAAPPRHLGQVVDALLAIYEPGLTKGLAACAKERPGAAGHVAKLHTAGSGDELRFVSRREAASWLQDFPKVVEAVLHAPPGLDVVIVYSWHWAAVRWMVRDRTDVGVPAAVYEQLPEPEPEDGADGAGPSGPQPPVSKAVACFEPAPPWAPLPEDIDDAWWFATASVFSAVVGVLGIVVCVQTYETSAVLSFVGLLVGVLTLGVSVLFLRSLFRVRRRMSSRVRREHWEAWHEWREAIEKQRREREAQRERKEWMGKLAKRLSRLGRLVEVDAPEIIIENEHRMIRDAIAELDSSDADAVLRAWPAQAKLLEDAGAKPKTTRRNEPN
jgi:hypothetical protein